MQNAVEVPLQMPRLVAEALLESLREQLRQGMQLHWYADRYREVPAGLRSQRILTDYPALAGHKRTIGALQAALNVSQQGPAA